MALTGLPPSPADPRGSVVVAGRDGDRTVVWLRGDHDMATTAELSGALARAMAIDEMDLVVDLTYVQFMDASTVAVFVRAREFLLLRSRALTLRAPLKAARRVLDACGLAELIDPDPPRSEAAGALGSWVAVPAIDRADNRADESGEGAAATTATPGGSERASEGATVLAARPGP